MPYCIVNRETYLGSENHIVQAWGKMLIGSMCMKLASWSPVKIKLFFTGVTWVRAQWGCDDMKWYVKGVWFSALMNSMKSNPLLPSFKMVANCNILKEFKEK